MFLPLGTWSFAKKKKRKKEISNVCIISHFLCFQSPEVGPAGQCGLPVAAPVAAELRPEDEHAPHPHPPTVGLTVQGRVKRGKLASCRTAVSIDTLKKVLID